MDRMEGGERTPSWTVAGGGLFLEKVSRRQARGGGRWAGRGDRLEAGRAGGRGRLRLLLSPALLCSLVTLPGGNHPLKTPSRFPTLPFCPMHCTTTSILLLSTMSLCLLPKALSAQADTGSFREALSSSLVSVW